MSAPKLQVLKIEEEDDGNLDLADFSADRKVQIFRDNLDYFCFTGCPINEYCICGSAKQLSKAEILVEYSSGPEVKMDVVTKRCYKLLSGLSWVQDLTLTEDFLKGLEQIPELVDAMPGFERRTQLNLKAPYGKINQVGSVMLMQIYEKCLHLEHLYVTQVLIDHLRGPLFRPMPSCFRTHIKRITFPDYFPGGQDDAVINVLLNSALVLEEMIIYSKVVDGSSNEDDTTLIKELEDELNGRPRVSNDCRISVVSKSLDI